MSSLRDFLGLDTEAIIKQVTVYYNDHGDSIHSGCCCLYTVESGISAATIELWGGGSGGAGACCCMWPYAMGSAGAYAMKKISLSEGTTLTICAAGSTGCSSSCVGTNGNPSFVNCNGSNIACAEGGCRSNTVCHYWGFSCGGNCFICSYGTSNVGDVSACRYSGFSNANYWCHHDHHHATQGTPKYSSNLRLGGTVCAISHTRMGCCFNRNHWPGGPGMSGGACGGGYCWGSWGAGGLAIVTLYG
jgi:hypothetical protein